MRLIAAEDRHVTVTIYGKQYTGQLSGYGGAGHVWVALDEPAVIDGPGWQQTVPSGKSVRRVTVPKAWVTVDRARDDD
jgi:hypothetical protein